jgi:hypothetical protein
MIIGITGYARSGKDTAANVLVEEFGFTKLAFADGVREMLTALNPRIRTGLPARHYADADGTVLYTDLLKAVGYEKAKAFEDVRIYLQRLGTEAVRSVLGDNTWLNLADKRMFDTWWQRDLAAAGGDVNHVDPNAKPMDFVLSDTRFENEARHILSRGGFVLRVSRPGIGNASGHVSEAGIPDECVTMDITADSVEDLQRQVRLFHAAVREQERLNAEHDMRERNMQQMRMIEAQTKPRVYVAATLENKADAIEVSARLEGLGIEVVSTWPGREGCGRNAETAMDLQQRQQHAVLDRNEVAAANVLLIVDGQTKSSGKATEMGMAIGAYPTGKRVIVVNAMRGGNVFYNLPEVEHVTHVDEALELIQAHAQYKDAQANQGSACAIPTPSTVGGFQRTLDPTTGRPLPGTPWADMPVEPVTTESK